MIKLFRFFYQTSDLTEKISKFYPKEIRSFCVYLRIFKAIYNIYGPRLNEATLDIIKQLKVQEVIRMLIKKEWTQTQDLKYSYVI
jgi:hypothetical protein